MYVLYFQWVMAISIVLKILLAFFLELSNDEAYYRLYAMFSDYSHYDHPPMLGWMLQIFTLDTVLDNGFALRILPIFLGTCNLLISFKIGQYLHSTRAGFLASFLVAISPYLSLISGAMLLPDAPLMFFWLLAIYWALKAFFPKENKLNHHYLLLVGLAIGGGILSKYTAAFLWVGIGIYILLFNRKTLKTWQLYVSILITILCCLPILWWNVEHDFVSFRFHSGRVGLFDNFEIIDFCKEILGEFIYNNPLIYIVIFVVLVKNILYRKQIAHSPIHLLYCIGFPIVIIFWLFSFSHSLLPHWNSPGFSTLLFTVAIFLAENLQNGRKKLYKCFQICAFVVVALLVIIVFQAKTDFLSLKKHGIQDFTIELTTWKATGEHFTKIAQNAQKQGIMPINSPIVALRWFPAANLDLYVAKPSNRKVLTIGDITQTHKYEQITTIRGSLPPNTKTWFITDDYDFFAPENYFSQTQLYQTFTIYRHSKPAKKVYCYIVTI